MAHIVILATGGTIAGTADTRSEGGYNAGQVTPEQLLAAVPQVAGLARISAQQVAAIGSQDMNDEVWFALARRIAALQADADVDGIVVTHGTDTLEETALFLHMVLPLVKPLVVVGAMRPSTAISADGPMNLFAAIQLASDARAAGRGVLVVLNDTIHGAADVTKTSTTAVQTFVSPNFGPLGHVTPNGIHFFRPPVPPAPHLPLPAAPPLPRVSILYAHAGMDGLEIEAAVAGGARGLVLAGVGDGNASGAAIAALSRAVQAGIPVVRSSRVGSGPVLRNIEVSDDAHGFVAAHFLNPAKARVLLQLLLANEVRDPLALQAGFDAVG
ncbi:asparaginase [Aquabacter sp. L1I39]|uniref:asparaginase n=1 Tax=Aquabacter sp. L1I39 TaxID=2820278 RepID=UPI001ADC3D3E|nr:asparaginase [Aquabacter sp. L1I39]QTL05275.1 asparaginase [Aquabacter sp. L1I39]